MRLKCEVLERFAFTRSSLKLLNVAMKKEQAVQKLSKARSRVENGKESRQTGRDAACNTKKKERYEKASRCENSARFHLESRFSSVDFSYARLRSDCVRDALKRTPDKQE